MDLYEGFHNYFFPLSSYCTISSRTRHLKSQNDLYIKKQPQQQKKMYSIFKFLPYYFSFLVKWSEHLVSFWFSTCPFL